jgi:hypothetical protein
MKIRITKGPVTKYQFAGQVDENDAWIRKMLEFEATRGAADGTGLSNWGYNSWKKLGHKRAPQSIDEAIQYYKEDFLPKVAQYPLELRKRLGDYAYNTGRNINDLLLFSSGKISLDDINSNNTFDDKWKQYGPEIQSMYSDPEFINSVDGSRHEVAKTTGTYLDPNNPNKTIRYSTTNPNPAYKASWFDRMNLFNPYQDAYKDNDVSAPVVTDNQNSTPLNINISTPKFKPITEPGPNEAPPEYFSQNMPSQQPASVGNFNSFNWQSFNEPTNVPFPKRTVVNPDGTKTTTGDFGEPTVFYKQNNDGTPLPPPNGIKTPVKKTPYAKGYDSIMNPARKVQKALQSPFMQNIYGAGAVANSLVDLATPIARYFDNRSKIKDAREKEMISRFNTIQPAAKFRGNFTVNDGLFRPDDRGVNEGMFTNNFYAPTMMYGGDTINDTPMKIRIKGVPTMKYGGQSNYGLDLNRRKVYADMEETSSETATGSMTQQSNAKEPYILEAEGGETIWRPDGTHFNINGNRHHSGGEKLTGEQAPAGSFIFSDTKKMKIKDPEILARFGVGYVKGGVTPAKIAKKFPLNSFISRLQDPTRQNDTIGMKSDKLSWNKNIGKLAELAMVQEAMKGMPPPAMSQAVVGAAEGAAQMAYGGHVMPKFQGANNPSTVKGGLGEWSDDYETLQKLLLDPKNAGLRKAMFQNFLQDYKKSPLAKDPQGEDKFIKNFLEAQRQFMGIRSAYGDQPNELTSESWDKNGKNKRYFEEAKKLGYTPLAENDIKRFQGGYRALAKAARNPEFFENFSKYFKLSPVGVKDEEFLGYPISKDDAWAGNTTIGQLAQLRNDIPDAKQELQYICNDKGEIVTVASGGYKTPEEARQKCPEKAKPGLKYVCINGTVVESPSGVGYSSREEAAVNCDNQPQKDVPFDYMMPDKLNMAWRMNRMVPNIYLPEMYQLPRRQYPMAFDDWMSRVQNRQSTYNTAMDTAAKTNQSQAVGSFLAGLVGAQDASDIAQVNSQNLERADRRQMMDMEADFRTDVFNLGQRQDYSKGLAVAQQQYDNALNKGVFDAIQSYADAFENRGDLYDINMRDPYFYRDPNSYKTIFKGASGNIFGPGSLPAVGPTGAASYNELGPNANSLYKQYYNSLTDVKDEATRASMAKTMMFNAMNTSRQTNTQTFDRYGFPRSSAQRRSFYNFQDNDD